MGSAGQSRIQKHQNGTVEVAVIVYLNLTAELTDRVCKAVWLRHEVTLRAVTRHGGGRRSAPLDNYNIAGNDQHILNMCCNCLKICLNALLVPPPRFF